MEQIKTAVVKMEEFITELKESLDRNNLTAAFVAAKKLSLGAKLTKEMIALEID